MTFNQHIHRMTAWASAHGLTSTALPAVAIGLPSQAPSQAPSQVPSLTQFDTAMAELEHGDWHHAYEHLAVLADAGDERAARTALMMHARGTRMFGGSYAADTARCQHWLATAGEAVEPQAAH